MFVEIVTASAVTLTAASSFPQMLKTWKTKSTRDLSLTFMLVLISGLSLWQIYTILRHDLIFQIGNAVSLLLWGSILAMKLVNVVRRLD